MYPYEHQKLALIDVTSQWFFQYGSTSQATTWVDRKSNPVVFEVESYIELERLFNLPFFHNKTITHFAGEALAVCIGPVWNSRLTEYNRLYKKLDYNKE